MLNVFNTSPELAESNVDTAVLALGSLEPKGPHLPIGLDLLLAEHFARDFCSGKAVYLLASQPYSSAVEARGFRGTVALSQQTLWDAVTDIATCLARHRFKRLIVLDFANYSWIVKQSVREINLDAGLLEAVWVAPKVFAKESADKALLPDNGGGAVETALAMALFPKLVRKPLVDFAPDAPREYIDYKGLKALAPEGYWGRPSRASAELGRRLYEIMLEKSREFVDYALEMFPGGRGLAAHKADEVWWPEGEIPGVEKGEGTVSRGVDWHNTLKEIAESGAEIAVLPTSSTEQHSPAMPLGTDYFQALEIARRVAGRLGAYLLPALPVITSWCHSHFRGTVSFRAMTARRVIEDAVASLYAGGFRKVAIVNFHGGNWVVKPTMIELNRAYGDLTLISTGDILAYRGQAASADLHANEGEGSFVRAFHPKAFKAERVVDFTPNCTASALDFVGMAGVSPHGVWGYPSRSTPEAGRKYIEAHAGEAASYIAKTFADLDKRFPPRLR